MQQGEIVEEGPVYDIFTRPQHPLTKDFIQTVLQFELPDQLLQRRNPNGTIVKIEFVGDLAEESIVSDVLQTCGVRGNILHGKIEYIQEKPYGIFIMELTGQTEEIQKALQLLRDRTSGVEVIADVAR
jgi:D-methionine transport system ATP-binding protein